MKEEIYRFTDRESCRAFLEKVTAEKIFHITRYSHFRSIVCDGYVRGGKNPEQNWPSYSSLFTNMGCVCLINNKESYRIDMPKENASIHAGNFQFSSPNFVAGYYGLNPVFLILADNIAADLVSWKTWKDEERHRKEKVVAYYEAGYKGNLPISKIESALILELDFPEEGGLIGAFKAARENMISLRRKKDNP